MTRLLPLIAASLLATPALAQDDEFEFEFSDEDEDEETPAGEEAPAEDEARPTGAATAPARSPRPPDKPPETPAPSPNITAPEAVQLSGGDQVAVEVEFQHEPKAPILTTSVGRMTTLVPLGDNRFTAKLVLPAETDQVFAVLSAWDDHQPGPPGLRKVRLTQPEGEKLRKGLRVAVVVVPARLRVDWNRPADVYLLVHNQKGKAEDSVLKLQAEHGKISEPERRSKGLYLAKYTPAPMIGTAFDSLSASPEKGVPGWAEVVVDGVTPKTPKITVSPERIRADGKSKATLRLTLATAEGKPLAGQPVEFEAIEGTVGRVTDKGEGVYEATYTSPDVLPPEGKVSLTVLMGEAIPGENRLRKDFFVGLKAGPPARVEIYSEPRRVPADGITSVKLYVTVVDSAGNPAEGAPTVTLDVGGEMGDAREQSAGNWVLPWTPPLLPELEFTKRMQVVVSVAGKELPLKGRMRLEPRAKPKLPGSRPLPDSLWSAEAGLTTLFGRGFAGAANGFSVQVGWLSRVGETPLYAGFVPGITLIRTTTGARDDAHMDDSFSGSIQAEVTQALVPVMATVLFQLQPIPAFDVYGGIGIGGLLAYTQAKSDVAFRGTADSLSLLGAINVPVGIEIPFGDGSLTGEVQYFRSIGDLSGAGEDEGIGVVGTIQGVSIGAGWRWGSW